MSITERLALLVTADTSNAVTNLDKLGKTSETSLSGMDKLKGAFGQLGSVAAVGSIAGAGAALGVAAHMAIDFAKAAEEDVRAQKLLESTIRNTTSATAEQISGTDEYITKLSMASTVADDQLRPALATLTRSTGDLGSAQKLLNLSLDVSAGTGADLGSVSEALSKAVQGNTKSLRALTPELGKLIKDGASANEIFGALSETYRGQAQEFASNNAFGQISIAVQEAKETIGTAFLPAIQAAANLIKNDFGPAMEALGPYINAVALSIEITSAGLGEFAHAVGAVKDSFDALPGPMKAVLSPISAIGGFFGSASSEADHAGTIFAGVASKTGLTADALKLLQANLGRLPPFFASAARAALDQASSLKILGTDADGLAGKLAKLSFSGVESQIFGNVEAQAKFNSTLDGFTKVAGGATKSAGDYEKKLRSIEDAQVSLTDAEKALQEAQINLFIVGLGSSSDQITSAQIRQRDATRSLADAQRAQYDAAKRLKDLQAGSEAGLLDAQAGYIQAQRDYADAEKTGDVVAMDRAKAQLLRTQQSLTEAQNPETTDAYKKALDDVERSSDKVTQAAIDQRKAQDDLNGVVNAGKLGSKDLKDAEKDVEDAHRKVEGAARDLGDAQDSLNVKTAAVGEAVKTAGQKFYDGLGAASAYLDYLRNNKASVDDMSAAVFEVEKKLGGVAAQAGKTAEFDSYIAKLHETRDAYIELNTAQDNGPWSGHQGPNGGQLAGGMTKDDLARAAASSVGINVTIKVKGDGVVDALMEYQSKNGSIPIRVSG